jgi:hypothetical protein
VNRTDSLGMKIFGVLERKQGVIHIYFASIPVMLENTGLVCKEYLLDNLLCLHGILVYVHLVSLQEQSMSFLLVNVLCI